jgi:Zn-dependent protease
MVLAVIFCLLAVTGALFEVPRFAGNMLIYGAIINMVLALFNLLPVPGLDGWNILRTYWRKDLSKSSEFIKGAFFILIMLVFTCFDYVTSAAAWVVLKFCNTVLSLLGGVL